MVATRRHRFSETGEVPDAKPQLSVVVPTYNETANLRPLTERLFKATREAGIECELAFADDESAGSAESAKIVETLAKEGYVVRLATRKRSEGRGLSSAVLLGFGAAEHGVVLCMDADLQHEPEAVPAVAAPVLEGRADFSVGSRNVGAGGVGFEWSAVRRAISAGATALALPLTKSTDPMSGFFCTTKKALARGTPRPVGFKIGLEIMVRCDCSRVVDVPITFREREAGESKLSAKQNVEYLIQLSQLYLFAYPATVLGVTGVGFSIFWTILALTGMIE
mmetsp:Transcript_33292/g.103153  ORF Transcript_33292/g.103153 Transcript_33292/m.103153 type:complete len:280 (+) Transcript_33292:505-1344(+)